MKTIFALAFFAASIAPSAFGQIIINDGASITGVWKYNGTHTLFFQEDRDGAMEGAALVDSLPNYEAAITAQKTAPGVYQGVGTQWYAPNGCVESYNATYILRGPNRLVVDIHGSDGNCGVPRDFRLTYEARREGTVPYPLQGLWLLNNTHRFTFNEDDFGGATGTVAVPSIPGYNAMIDVQARFPSYYEGYATQTMSGCTTEFNARYAVLGRNKVRVFVLGSNGACGTDPNIRIVYDIARGR